MSNNTLENSYESLPVQSKLIFLAGLFDGEGSFGLWSNGKGNPKRFSCTIEMVDKDILKRFSEMFGGTINPHKKRKEHHTQTYRWRIHGKRAYTCVNKMIKLMSKRRQEKFYVVQCS